MARLVSTSIVVLLASCLCAGAATTSQAKLEPAVVTLVLQAQPAESSTAPESHGLSAKAVQIANPFGFPITNSMLVSWVVAIGIVVFAQKATKQMERVPTGAQNLLE